MLGGKINTSSITFMSKKLETSSTTRETISYHCLTSVFSQVYKETELGILIIPFGQHCTGNLTPEHDTKPEVWG